MAARWISAALASFALAGCVGDSDLSELLEPAARAEADPVSPVPSPELLWVQANICQEHSTPVQLLEASGEPSLRPYAF